MRISSLWAQLSRSVRWHRRPLAALAAGLALLLALQALSPSPPASFQVVVAADDLAAGTTLQASDLHLAHFPTGLVPAQSYSSTQEAVGKVVAAPLSKGSPVTASSTVSTELTPRPGELLVPFHVQDAQLLSLVHVGDRVTVVAAGNDGQVTTLANRVRVAALPRGASASGGLVTSGDGAQPLVVVATDPTTAARLAAWGSGQALGIALG